MGSRFGTRRPARRGGHGAKKFPANELPAKELPEVMEIPLPAMEKTAMEQPSQGQSAKQPSQGKSGKQQSANPKQADPADPALAWLSAKEQPAMEHLVRSGEAGQRAVGQSPCGQ